MSCKIVEDVLYLDKVNMYVFFIYERERERERERLPQLKVCPLFYSEQIDRRSRDLLNTACLLIIHLN